LTAGRTSAGLGALALLGLVVAAALVALPFASLLVRVEPLALLGRLGEPAILAALRLSVLTSLLATVVAVLAGTPLAWLLETRRFPGRRVCEVLVDLPMVVPPTVAGFALLLAFGRAGLAGGGLAAFGVALPFTTAAVVIAQAFMAFPFFVGAARAGFRQIDRRYLDAAAALGADEATTFVRVAWPLARPALVAGTAMACARALGEFGATITFAGNLPGVTQTMPLAVYVALHEDLDAAVALSVVLLAIAVTILAVLRHEPRVARRLPSGRVVSG
jgi:molybdate transport system permease protein